MDKYITSTKDESDADDTLPAVPSSHSRIVTVKQFDENES